MTTDSDVFDLEELMRLLRWQKQLYQQLDQLSAQQGSLIGADQGEHLLQLLSQRQKIVKALSKLHDQLQPYRERWDRIRDRLDEQQRAQIETILQHVQQLLGQIIRRDEEDSRQLTQRKGQIQKAISGVGQSRQVAAAYGGQVQQAGRAINGLGQ